MSYASLMADWRRDPEQFWATAADRLHWQRRWDRVLDTSAVPTGRWFSGGEINTAFNALDRHVEAGHGDRPALIFDSAMTDTRSRLTYEELRDRVALLAGALRDRGVGRGDRVVIYMPMVPEAVIAMLACARLGAIHSVVFGGFAAPELATRIDDAKPKAVLAASCGLEPGRIVAYKPLLDQALEIASHQPDSCVILQRPEFEAELTPTRDIGWDEFLAGASAAGCVAVKATDPLYILYTSGTTGQPKGIVRDNGSIAIISPVP